MPFTREQFFEVFRRYNEAVWPTQALLLGLGLAAAYFAFRRRSWSDRFIVTALAVFWAWMGVVYHFRYFRPINPAANVFGTLFVLQAILLLWSGLVQGRLRFQASRDRRGIAGGSLLVYGFVVYPLLGRSFGHPYPESPTFGLPCPTTIVTLGLLLWAERPVPISILLIPIAWSLVGTSAAIRLGVQADWGLGVAGAVALTDIVLGIRQRAVIRSA